MNIVGHMWVNKCPSENPHDVLVHTCACLCVCVCVCVCFCVCSLCVFSLCVWCMHVYPANLFVEVGGQHWVSSSMALSGANLTDWLASCRDLSVLLCSHPWNCSCSTISLGFHMGAWDLNSCLHAYTVNTKLTKPSFQPSEWSFIVREFL